MIESLCRVVGAPVLPWVPRLTADDLVDFAAGIILPLRGGPVRTYAAAGWRGAPDPTGFLRAAPPDVRRMVDSDGERVDLYLDDLHEDGVMARVLGPEGLSSIRFCEPWLDWPGRYAERDGADPHRLWISEARWSGDLAGSVDRVATRWGLPSCWAAVEAWAADHGLHAYVDASDLRASGPVDLTVGLA